jgi:hypothetical protein
MKNHSFCRLFFLLFWALITSWQTTCAIAAENISSGPESVKNAVVIVLAKGVLPAQVNVPVSEQGTGFFISKYGFLVTSYHLRSDLGAVDDPSVTYEIHFGALPSDTIVSASPVFANPAADIMVLYAPVAQRDVLTLQPSTMPISKIIPGTTPIFTGGYPRGYDYSVDRGVIKSFGVISPPLPLWSTSISFKAGQSGSPILFDDNTVIGIAKGVDTADKSIGLVVPMKLVPIEYWGDSLQLSQSAAAALSTGKPDTLGSVVVEASVTSPVTVQKTTEFTLENGKCVGPSSKQFHVTASPGSRINPLSIKLTALSIQATVDYSITESTASGFTIGAILVNSGHCLPEATVDIAGVPVRVSAGINDTSAIFVGRATYSETSLPNTAKDVTVSDVTPIGNVDVPLPRVAVKALSFATVSPNGEKVPFEPLPSEITKVSGAQFLDIKKIAERLIPGG